MRLGCLDRQGARFIIDDDDDDDDDDYDESTRSEQKGTNTIQTTKQTKKQSAPLESVLA